MESWKSPPASPPHRWLATNIDEDKLRILLHPNNWRPFQLPLLNISYARTPKNPIIARALPSAKMAGPAVHQRLLDITTDPYPYHDPSSSPALTAALSEVGLMGSGNQDAYRYLHSLLDVVSTYIYNFAVLYGVTTVQDRQPFANPPATCTVHLSFGPAELDIHPAGLLRFTTPAQRLRGNDIPPALAVVDLRRFGVRAATIAGYILALAQSYLHHYPSAEFAQPYVIAIQRPTGDPGSVTADPVYTVCTARVTRAYLLSLMQGTPLCGEMVVESSKEFDPAVYLQRLAFVDLMVDLVPRVVMAGVEAMGGVEEAKERFGGHKLEELLAGPRKEEEQNHLQHTTPATRLLAALRRAVLY